MSLIKYIKINKIFFLVLLVFGTYIFNFRYNIDRDNIFIASDGQIKFFQTIQITTNFKKNIECYYPEQELDPDFKYYPIRYPWTIINSKLKTCVYEYPPFFPTIASLFLWNDNYRLIMYVPLLLYLIAFIIFFLILNNFAKVKFLNVILALMFFYSFPLLTSMDFSESPLYHLSIIIALYYFSLKADPKWQQHLLFGILLGISIFFRMEILIPAFAISIFIFLSKNDFKDRFKNAISFGCGFLITINIFFIYNYFTSKHILGYRYISSLLENRIVSPDLSFKFQLLRSYLLGDEIMYGILKFYPILFVLLILTFYLIVKNKLTRLEFIFICSGFISLFLIPLSVNFYGGVGYFGLRYLETAFLLILLGYGLVLNRTYNEFSRYIQFAIFALIITSLYWNQLSTKEGMKVLRNSSKDFSSLQNSLILDDSLVIHTSLYTSIFVGPSFLNTPHFHIPNETEITLFLKSLPKKYKKVIFLLPPENMYISSDIPDSLIQNYKTNVNPSNLNILIQDSKELNGVTIITANTVN
ncbi:MAG: hypothetical protein GW938_03210 [Leptospira sp.]|nr:hypothetical protein [Leptospira sp.]NCS94814.1 hypothetical protein [Leptospira sp.]